MNKKAGTKTILKTIIGLIIAIAVIVVLLNVMDKFLLFGKDEPNQQMDFFDELNTKIKELNTNQETQLFQLQDKYLLIFFNNKDVSLKDKKETTGGYTINIDTTVKKPPQCTNCLCLCKTEYKKYLFENDCLQQDDLCIEHEKEITNNNQPFFLFGKDTKELKIKKTSDKINIEYE